MGTVSKEREQDVLGGFFIGQRVVIHKRARGHWTEPQFGVISGVSEWSYDYVLEVAVGDFTYEVHRDDVLDVESWVKWTHWEHRYAD